jgi:anti-sigma factor RsiW
MSCEEVRDHLSAFLDGELEVWQRRRVEARLLGASDGEAWDVESPAAEAE